MRSEERVEKQGHERLLATGLSTYSLLAPAQAVRPPVALRDGSAVISPKARLDIFEDDENPICGDAASSGNQFGQLGAERVSFFVGNTDALQFEEGRSASVASEGHLWNGCEAGHDVGLRLVQLRRDDLGRGCGEVISLFLRDIDIGLDR